MAGTKFRDLRVSLGLDVSQLEKGFQAAQDRSARFERALKAQEEAAKRGEKALNAHEAQLKRSAAQMDAIGSSALRTRRLLEDATKRLPRLEINADSSPAERRLADLTGRLRELSGMRLGIDIDAADAQEKVAQVRRDLMTLDDEHPEVMVDVDVERAITGLERVEREARKVDGRMATIDVDVEGGREAEAAIGGVGRAVTGLGSAGVRSGPAGAAVAIAALPTAATVAAAGIVTVLGGALAGIGLAGAHGSTRAQRALEELKGYAQAEAAHIGQPFERVWDTIVKVAERELAALSPTMRDALSDLAPDVESFVDQAGSSLEELEPAIAGVQRAFSAVLRELGPAMPEIMRHFANAITSITDAVEENPQVIEQLAVGLATLVEWAGKAIGALTRFQAWLAEDGKALTEMVTRLSPAASVIAHLGMAAVESGGHVKGLGRATRDAGGAAEDTARATAAAAARMKESWAQAFTEFVDLAQAIDDAKSQASAQTKLAEASARLAETQRAGAEKIRRAQADLAQAHEQATERIAAAQDRVRAARERAAEQAEQSKARIRAAQEALAAAVEQAAQRERAAQEGVEEARRRAGEVAADSSRAIADATRRVADAQAEAAAREADAARRVQDAHARTADAVRDLEDAYARARDRVRDLADAQAEGATDEESAAISLERARQRLAELQAKRAAGDSGVSDLDLREAENSLARAEQSLTRVQKRNAELREEIDRANREGLEGAEEVLQAKRRLAEAQQAEREAEEALAQQRSDNARAMADAEQALADARAKAARDQEESDRALARAQAELDQARKDSAADIQRAQGDVATATRDAATAARDAARDIAAAQADVATATREAADAVADAEGRVRQARSDAARDTVQAGQQVRQAWLDLRGDAGLTTDELIGQLEKQVAAQHRWEQNMISLAGRVPPEVLGELAKLGPGGAEQVEKLAGATDAQLQRLVAAFGRRGKEAGSGFADELAATGAVLEEVARRNGRDAADRLRQAMLDKRQDVYEAAWDMGLQVDRGLDLGRVRVVKISVGDLNELIREKKMMRERARETGGIDRYAAGGIRRPTAPMIASRPTVLFGEGRADEAFIPYDVQYRRRAEGMLGQVADDFGGVFLKPGVLTGATPVAAPATVITQGGNSYSITVQVQPGADLAAAGAAAVRAIQAYETGSGSGWRRTT